MLDKWFRILGPEHDETGMRIRHIASYPIEWIGPYRISHIEPVEKPIGVERRDVSAAAGRNYHRRLSLACYAEAIGDNGRVPGFSHE